LVHVAVLLSGDRFPEWRLKAAIAILVTRTKGTTMSSVIAFLLAVGHDPSKSGSARNKLWEPAFLLGFVGLAALFVWEVVSS